MKKLLLMVVAAMMATVSTNAQNQDLRHELSLSCGIGSITQLGDGLGEGLAMALFSDTEYDDGFHVGPISLEYFYHLNNPRLALGGYVSFSKWDSDIVKRNDNSIKVGERERNYWSVMPAIKWYWVNTNSFGLYSKGAAGLVFLSSKEKSINNNSSKDDNSTHFMYQLSLLGAEAGGQFRGFAEVGFGEQGFLLAGIRYKF